MIHRFIHRRLVAFGLIVAGTAIGACASTVEVRPSSGDCPYDLEKESHLPSMAATPSGTSTLGGHCLGAAAALRDDGSGDCVVIELHPSQGDCACDASLGLVPVSPEHATAAEQARRDPMHSEWTCACEVARAKPEVGPPCPEWDDAPDLVGWCYEDARLEAEQCPIVRFYGPVVEHTSTDRTLITLCRSERCGE